VLGSQQPKKLNLILVADTAGRLLVSKFN